MSNKKTVLQKKSRETEDFVFSAGLRVVTVFYQACV